MEFRNTLLIIIIIPSVLNYSIKINPVLNTKVQNIKNQGDGNSIQLAQISNSTILNQIPSAVYNTHINELWSTTIILWSFSITFIILSVTITRLALTVFKLNLSIINLEQAVIYKVNEF